MSELKCNKCNIEFSRKDAYERHFGTDRHLMSPEDYKAKLSKKGRDSINNGRSNELFVFDILKRFDLDNVVYEGHTANKFDIFIKFKDEPHYRGLQVKTMIYYPKSDSFMIKHARSPYDDDTLIVAVSNSKDNFAVFSYEDMPKNNMLISKTHNTHRLITDLDTFSRILIEKARFSTLVHEFNDHMYESHRQEAESMERFKKKCDDLGIPFERNGVNTDEVDGVSGPYNLQFKSTISITCHTSQFCLYRRIGGVTVPYSVDDKVDFFIFENVTPQYQNNFYIIPKSILNKDGYIKSPEHSGKLNISIALCDNDRPHWTLNFLNKYDQLTSAKSEIISVRNRLHEKCLNLGLECKFVKNKTVSINSWNVKHLKSYRHSKYAADFFIREQINKIMGPIHSSRNYDFIIFDYGDEYPDDFCVIHSSVLIKDGFIATDATDGETSIRIPFPFVKRPYWHLSYVNNFKVFNNTKAS